MSSLTKRLPVVLGLISLSVLTAACAAPPRREVVPPSPRATVPPTPAPRAPVPRTVHVLYFYFAPEGCPHCRNMASVVQKFYEAYGPRPTPSAWRDRLLLAGLNFPPVQLPDRTTEVEVYGVTIPGGTNVEGFRRRTGFKVPVIRDPGLPVNTRNHPVTVFYNKETHVHRVAAIGAVSYEDLTVRFRAYTDGRPTAPASGGT